MINHSLRLICSKNCLSLRTLIFSKRFTLTRHPIPPFSNQISIISKYLSSEDHRETSVNSFAFKNERQRNDQINYTSGQASDLEEQKPIKISIDDLADQLETILALTKDKGVKIAKDDAKTLGGHDDITRPLLLETLRFLQEEMRIPFDKIVKVPWIVFQRKEKIADQVARIKRLLNINEIECVLPFVKYSPERILDLSAMWKIEMSRQTSLKKFPNRIYYFAKLLKSKPEKITNMMIKVPYIMSILLTKAEDTIKILKDGGVKAEDIVKDPYIFMHNPEKIVERLKKAQDGGLKVIKPWVLRCSIDIFEMHMSKQNHENSIKGDHRNNATLLSERLEIPFEEAQIILDKLPAAKKYTATKIDEQLKFVFSKGFTGQHVVRCPRVLKHSVETLEKRYRDLTNIGVYLTNLNPLCQSEKSFLTIKQHAAAKHDKKLYKSHSA